MVNNTQEPRIYPSFQAGWSWPQRLNMGGGKKFAYPKFVWSPSGGWWCNPKNWRRNTLIAFGVYAAICIPVAYIALQLERRPVPPYRHIPSQRLAKYAKVDDPSLPDNYQLINYKN
ncbi:uncharacterized protein LOC116613693 [Nematostella vectensis]|uniref:uncharacterized protein LOC116613693 n=1 Tax=Nematostella vectensis TaxID=45351 RepID=UPI0013901F45|nr:uncharacterized protein LOC116613693 [Nematostella vectensis]